VARIVSGVQQSEGSDFGAVLRGYQGAQKSRIAEDENRRQQAELMLKIQQAALEHRQEEAKSQALLNQQAQMGDAQALQQLQMKMQAGAHPAAQVIKDAMGTLSRITDPKARAVAAQAFKGGIAEVHKRQQQKAALSAIERAQANGLAEPEAYVERLKSGENPQTITQELGKLEHDQTLSGMASERAAGALAHAEELVKSAPQGRGKLLAQYVLTRYKNSPHDQSKPGSDAAMLEEVQKALLGSQSEYEASDKARREGTALAPGLGGMTIADRNAEMEKQPHGPFGFGLFGDTVGSGGPDIPPFQATGGPQAHATLRRGGRQQQGQQPATASQPPRAPKANAAKLPEDKIIAAATEEDLVKVLQESGVPLTHENLSAAANLWRPRE